MQLIGLDNPIWFTTFPHRVTPHPNEWIAGLLLRCDEANQWESGTTHAYLQRTHATKGYGYVTTNLIFLPEDILSDLADHLAIAPDVLRATTYRTEIARIFGTPDPSPKRLAEVLKFQICPECIAEARLLRRTLVLPEITSCPWHQLMLLKACQCGTMLHLFSRPARPFTCSFCGLEWAKLPRIRATLEDIELQKKYLLSYALFLSRGTPIILERTLRHIGVKLREEKGDEAFWENVLFPKWWRARPLRGDQYQTACSLSLLVNALVHFNLSPYDILTSDAPLFGSNNEWCKLYYYAVVKMIAPDSLSGDSRQTSSGKGSDTESE